MLPYFVTITITIEYHNLGCTSRSVSDILPDFLRAGSIVTVTHYIFSNGNIEYCALIN